MVPSIFNVIGAFDMLLQAVSVLFCIRYPMGISLFFARVLTLQCLPCDIGLIIHFSPGFSSPRFYGNEHREQADKEALDFKTALQRV